MNEIITAAYRLQTAESFREQGRLDEAKQICIELLKEYPDFYAALHTLGLVHCAKEEYQIALGYLSQALAYYPNSKLTLTALGYVYRELEINDVAIDHLNKAIQIGEPDAQQLSNFGEILYDEREYELAIHYFEKALLIDPGSFDAKFGLARTLDSIGEYSKTASVLEGLLNSEEVSVNFFQLISKYTEKSLSAKVHSTYNLLAKESNISPSSLPALRFAQARVHEKKGAFQDAARLILEANQLKLTDLEDAESHAFKMQFESRKLALETTPSSPINDRNLPFSLFIFGPSRSGKTTIEKLIGSFPMVKKGYENPIVTNAIKKTLRQENFISTHLYGMLPIELYDKCRSIYVKELLSRCPDKKYFTNTAPGLIHSAIFFSQIIPNTRFIFVKRNRDDLAYRIYSNHYRGRTNAYAYRLSSIYNHIDWYYEMIDILLSKLPSISAVVCYEELVKNPHCLNDVFFKLTGEPTPLVFNEPIFNDVGYADKYNRLFN
jgi:tetratricopeptide (TPR) repeat protein